MHWVILTVPYAFFMMQISALVELLPRLLWGMLWWLNKLVSYRGQRNHTQTESQSNLIPKWMDWGQTGTCPRLNATFNPDPWPLEALYHLQANVTWSTKCTASLCLPSGCVLVKVVLNYLAKRSKANIHCTVCTTTLVKLIGTEQFYKLNWFQIHILKFF